jgi:hypothetical protein
MPTYADVCAQEVALDENLRMLTYADVCGRMRTYADVYAQEVALDENFELPEYLLTETERARIERLRNATKVAP